MRRAFGKEIAKLADRDDKVFLITGDIGYRIFDEFRAKHSERFINIGICEQSMIGFASGLALEGLKPWVYTITPFLIERPFEQIKLDIDQQKANVKLVGFADYPTLGPTHSELDASSLMKLFTNIRSYFPKNGSETINFVNQAYQEDKPAFISLKSDPDCSASFNPPK
jgi:transketolase